MEDYELVGKAYKILENEIFDANQSGKFYIRNLETAVAALQEVINKIKVQSETSSLAF